MKINGDKAKELCLRLLAAQTETEVIQLLQEGGYWSDRTVWVPYGGVANNRSIVGNQQNSAIAALVEKIVNSIDAVLTAECYKAGLEPKGAGVPRSMRAAVEKFFSVRDGRVLNLDAASRTALAERIQVVATGLKESPCYVVLDDGEGQTPDQFP